MAKVDYVNRMRERITDLHIPAGGRVRVVRTLVYEGTPDWIITTLAASVVGPDDVARDSGPPTHGMNTVNQPAYEDGLLFTKVDEG